MTQFSQRIVWLSTLLISVLLVLMPFHAFGITVTASLVGHKELLSTWKEIVVIIIAACSLFYWFFNRAKYTFDSVNIIAWLIIVLSLVVSLFNHDWHKAFLVGVKTNLVALILFFCAQLFAEKFSEKKLQYLILVPAGIVVVLAFLQPYLFHPSFLLKIGYGPEGSSGAILAGQYIESAASTVRAFSTLGGPNQLGTYLLVPTLLSSAYFAVTRRWYYLALAALFAAGVFVSYSRSALIGLACGLLVLVAVQLPKKIRLITFGLIGLILVSFLYLLLSPNQCSLVQTLPKSLIHGTCIDGQLAGSDQQRIESQRAGINAIHSQPLGYGLGSAGPASFSSMKPLITENWYLQIAIEVGLLGITLYIIFFVLLARGFYISASQNGANSIWPATCLAIIVGVGVAAMFLHSWADSTLSVIAFSIFGIVKGKKI